MWENETAAVGFGQKVLIPCQSHQQARQWIMEMVQECRDMEPDLLRSVVRCGSGGFAHFAWRDDQVRGMEYHEALGPLVSVVGLSDVMRSRVRFSTTHSMEKQDD
jgi:hypothetical protein